MFSGEKNDCFFPFKRKLTSFIERSSGDSIILLTTYVKMNMSTVGDITTMLGSNTEDVCLKGRTSDKHRGTFEPWTAIHSNIDWEWSLPTLRNLKAYLQLLVIIYMIYKGIDYLKCAYVLDKIVWGNWVPSMRKFCCWRMSAEVACKVRALVCQNVLAIIGQCSKYLSKM